MCRIAGILDKKSKTIEADILSMRDSMKNGGPDNSGVYYDEEAKLTFGHRRLSIIDLSEAGNQPMYSKDKNIVITYNGEIYNYRELKKELQQAGQVFYTNTDTEVIINGYKHWGTDCFEKLKGMFAFAIYDKGKQEIILVRDPSGIKPLYYYIDGSSLYFASEIKAFKSTSKKWEQDKDWKIYFLTYGYLPEPITTLKGVAPLAKGCFLKVNTNTLACKTVVYATERYSNKINSIEEAISVVTDKLNKAVERHLISDAPIGLFLSGGIDSSLLTLIAKNNGHKDLHTLSIIFDDNNFSEEKYQHIIADKVQSEHKAYKLDKELFLNALPDIFSAMDQPTSDGVNTYFICKFAKAYGLKAVLSGLGADELFGGYASFHRKRLISRLNNVPSTMLGATSVLRRDKYKKISFLKRRDPIGEYLFNRGFFSTRETSRILDANTKYIEDKLNNITVPGFVDKLSYGNKVSYMERNLYMQSQLLKDTDMMSMWHSIEVRVPFLDIDLVNAVNEIASDVKFNHNRSKYLLIESYKDILPEEIWNRRKQGFVFPFQKWMMGDESQYLNSENEGLTKRFQLGNLNWSRYWTYLVSNHFEA